MNWCPQDGVWLIPSDAKMRILYPAPGIYQVGPDVVVIRNCRVCHKPDARDGADVCEECLLREIQKNETK